MSQLYFAYGSNLLTEQMIARTGPLGSGEEGPRIARLPNYRFAFNMLGSDGQVYANIVPSGDGVLGVIYCCTDEALKKLDGFESGYDRHNVLVIDNSGQELSVITYIAKPQNVTAAGQPSAAYLRKIVTGARAHGLLAEYIQFIEAAGS